MATSALNLNPPSFSLPAGDAAGAWEPKTDERITQLAKDVIKGLQPEGFSAWTFFRWKQHPIVSRLSEMDPKELGLVLKKVAEETMSPIPLKSLERLGDLLDFNQLEKALATWFPQDFTNAVEAAQSKVPFSDYFHKYAGEKTTSFNVYNFLENLWNGSIHVMDTVLLAFGIADFFDPLEHDWEAGFRLQKLQFLFMMLSSLSATSVAILGAATGGIIASSLLIFLFVFNSIYQKYLKPLPDTLPYAPENLTKLITEGKLPHPYERSYYNDLISEELIRGEKTHLHVLLYGPSGIGKSEIKNGFAHAAYRGDYPELQGKRIFCYDTSQLRAKAQSHGAEKILKQIGKAMGRHRDDIVLIFEEFHNVGNDEQSSFLADLFKMALDKTGDLRHVIAITTDKEYAKYIQPREPLDRRFEKNLVESMGESDCMRFLHQIVNQEAPQLLCDEKVLKHLYDEATKKFPDHPQPHGMHILISKCIRQLIASPRSKASENQENLELLISKGVLDSGYSSRATEREKAIKELKDRVDAEQVILHNEKANISVLRRTQDLFVQSKAAMHQEIRRVKHIQKDSLLSPRDKSSLKRFFLLNYFLIPELKNAIRSQAMKAGIQAELTQELVDRVLEFRPTEEKK